LEEFPDFDVAVANCEFRSVMDIDVDVTDVVGSELVAQALRDEADKLLDTVQMGHFLSKVNIYREAAFNASVKHEPRPTTAKYLAPSTVARPPVSRPSKAAIQFLSTGKPFVPASRALSIGVPRSGEVMTFTKAGGQKQGGKKVVNYAARIWNLFLEVGESSGDLEVFAEATGDEQAQLAEFKQENWSELPEESPARFETRRPEERAPGDSRFAARRADRVYVCDNASCRSRKAYAEIKKSLPFDGQYVVLLETRGYSAAELEQRYEAKNVDATWWCSACHRRPSERDLDETRRRIEAFDIDRCERTCLLGASVFLLGAEASVSVKRLACILGMYYVYSGYKELLLSWNPRMMTHG